jgi:hypothetical protein
VSSQSELPYLELCARARELIKAGRLPVVLPRDVSGGYGSFSNSCALCECPILPAEVEYAAQTPSDRTLFFHLDCYFAWHDECRRLLEADEESSGSKIALEPTAEAAAIGRVIWER